MIIGHATLHHVNEFAPDFSGWPSVKGDAG